jgi:hypothetical protein
MVDGMAEVAQRNVDEVDDSQQGGFVAFRGG